MVRFEILTAERVNLFVSEGIRAGLVMPWLAELTLHVRQFRPAPFVHPFPGYGPLINVGAVRWVGARVDVCYTMASDRNPAEPKLVLSSVTRRQGTGWAWAPSPVDPPTDIRRWAEWDVADRLPSQVIDCPTGPAERLRAEVGGPLPGPGGLGRV